MKAAQINGYGGQEVLRVVGTAAKPAAGSGQVLVEVQAAAVNPFDWKVREGLARSMKEVEFPATLGGDVAGVVAELGEDTGDFTIGQPVYGQANALGGQGSLAEFTVVKAGQLAAKPATADFLTAAALPLTGVSAYQALVEHIGLQAGQKILIHGGAGGIGSLAVQLAKHLRAYVATTVAADDFAFAKELGADETIDYHSQDFSKLLSGYDAVFDTVGGATNKQSYQILKRGAALVSMSAPSDDALVKQYGVRYTAQFTRTTTERLAKLAELVDNGVLKVHIDKVFPLDQAGQALEYLHTGHPRGKVVVEVKANQNT